MVKKFAFLILFTLFSASLAFSQAVDIPVNTGARMNAMASAGCAIADGGMAIAMNPAGLANIKSFEFEGTANMMMIDFEQPANGPYQQKRITAFSAIGLFGMGGRLNEFITVGFLLYAPSGGGARFENATSGYALSPGFNLPPKDTGGYLVFLEFGPCIALNLPGGLKIGFEYRINYSETWGDVFQADTSGLFGPPPRYLYTSNHLSGYGFTGFRVGMQWDPIETLHFGVAYRSYVKINASGTSRINPIGPSIDINQSLKYADGLRAGVSYEFVPRKFIVSLDYGLDFWSRYNYLTVETLGIPNMTPLKMRNVHTGRIGFELKATDTITVRWGASYTTDAENHKYQGLKSNGSPLASQIFAAGLGFRLNEHWVLDFAFNYLQNQGRITGFDYVRGGGFAVPGLYNSSGGFIGIGLRYNL